MLFVGSFSTVLP